MPQGTPLINGVGYTWSQIVLSIAGTPVYGISAIEYEDKQEIENIYGAGQYPVERGEGKIECSCKLTLFMSEVEAIQQRSGSGRLQDVNEFDIVVSFQPGGSDPLVRTHTIKNCRFKDNSRKIKQGDTKVEVELELICSHIIWK